MIVPIHCDDWAHFTQSAEDLEQSFKALGIATRLRLPKSGVPITIGPGRSLTGLKARSARLFVLIPHHLSKRGSGSSSAKVQNEKDTQRQNGLRPRPACCSVACWSSDRSLVGPEQSRRDKLASSSW